MLKARMEQLRARLAERGLACELQSVDPPQNEEGMRQMLECDV